MIGRDKMPRTVLRTDLILETCGQQPESYPHCVKSHGDGCYIRFKPGKAVHTRQRDDCIVDYDEKGKIIGIEFYDGLHDMEGY
jgi:hypothetical protein